MYFGARYYDAELSIWHVVDPMADKYPSWTPYNYTLNNPIKFTDPTGNNPEWIDNGDGTYTAQKGDSAFSLSKDAKISPALADKIVQDYHGCNYIGSDGGIKSNIDPGDQVRVRDVNNGSNTVNTPEQLPKKVQPLKTKSDGLRALDFYTFNASVAIPNPVTGTGIRLEWNSYNGQTFSMVCIFFWCCCWQTNFICGICKFDCKLDVPK